MYTEMTLLDLSRFNLDDDDEAQIAGDWVQENFPISELASEVMAEAIRKKIFSFDYVLKDGRGNGSGNGSGYGYGNGSGYGSGNGSGYGSGDGYGSGNGSGYGSGDGYGSGNGYGNGSGDGYGGGDGGGYGSVPDLSLCRRAVMIGSYVVVRTYSAGVDCGVLKSVNGTTVVLAECSKIHRWSGANTCKELAMRGPSMEYTRISEQVSLCMLTEAIEIIACTEEAEKNLRQVRWG